MTTTRSVVFVPPMSRRIQRISWVLLAATLIGVLGMIAVPWFQANAREASRIRVRYAAMRVALSAGDTNAALALLAPYYPRGGHRLAFLGVSVTTTSMT